MCEYMCGREIPAISFFFKTAQTFSIACEPFKLSMNFFKFSKLTFMFCYFCHWQVHSR